MTILTKEKLIELKNNQKTDVQIRDEFNLSRTEYEKIKNTCGFKKHHTTHQSDEPFAEYAVVMTDDQRLKLYKGQRYDME